MVESEGKTFFKITNVSRSLQMLKKWVGDWFRLWLLVKTWLLRNVSFLGTVFVVSTFL